MDSTDNQSIDPIGDVAGRFADEHAVWVQRRDEGLALLARAGRVIARITYKHGFEVRIDTDDIWNVWFEICCWRPDAITGEMGWGHGGHRYLRPEMTDSDIVRNVFAGFKAYEEHECREFFRYRGEQVFGPHMDLDDLAQKLADAL